MTLCFIAFPVLGASGGKEEQVAQYLQLGRQAKTNMDAMRQFITADGMAKQSGNDSLIFWTQYEIGRIYYVMNATGEALDHFTQAYEICQSAKLGPKPQMYVLNGIAAIYDENEDYSKALPIVQKSLQLALAANDTLAIITYYANVAVTANNLKNYQLATQMLDAADKCSAASNDEATYKDMVRCQLLYSLKRYNDCLALAPSVIESRKLTNIEKSIIMPLVADIYMQRGEYTKARDIIRKALAICALNDKWKCYSVLSEISKREGNYTSALLLSDSIVLFKDSLFRTNNKRLERANQFKLDAMMLKSNYEDQLNRYRQNVQNGFFVLLFLVIVVVGIGYYRFQKSRQDRKLLDLQMKDERSKKLLAEQKMHETKVIAEYQQNMLQQKISQKKHELEMSTMFVSSRNALIEELISSISSIKEIADNRELKNIIRNTRQTIGNANDNDEFLAKFQEANPEFMETMRRDYPQLTGSDIRFLVYVKMDYPTKEIASLLGISPASCKQKKTRIAKKLGLENATAIRTLIQKI